MGVWLGLAAASTFQADSVYGGTTSALARSLLSGRCCLLSLHDLVARESTEQVRGAVVADHPYSCSFVDAKKKQIWEGRPPPLIPYERKRLVWKRQ